MLSNEQNRYKYGKEGLNKLTFTFQSEFIQPLCFEGTSDHPPPSQALYIYLNYF